MSERIDPEGNRFAVSPGEMAQLDQVSADFRALTERLIDLHDQAAELVRNQDNLDVEVFKQYVSQVNKEIFGLMTSRFSVPDDSQGDMMTRAANALSFIMFLIDIISVMRVREQATASAITGMQGVLSRLAIVYGVDATGGGDLDTSDEGFETFTTGVGQELVGVHPKDVCEGFCVVHNPIPGPWADWPTVWRGDGPGDIWSGFERRCPCGVGHTAMEEVLRGVAHSHGCCGQCPCGPPAAQPVFNEVSGDLEGYR